MGVVLVCSLLVSKLTVATGMLSGLVFYANIVGANHAIFLPEKCGNPFSIFIAWLNLDFGIETCFYNGMDVYIKTWLQFVFPVGLIVLVRHFSHRFANLLVSNQASILATLILLSYAKILRILITVFDATNLEYPTYKQMVWLYDANVDYLVGKHILLLLVAAFIFLFLFLPYSFLLLFGQWLQVILVSNARLKSFMDSYHAPYKAKHHYWPGLLLMLRLILLLVCGFQSNFQQDGASINLSTILMAIGVLVVWAWASGGVYRNWGLDVLEGSFALNLIILTATTYYVKHSGGNQCAVGYTSVSIAVATFIGILVLQLASITPIAQYFKRKCAAVAFRNTHQAEAELEPPDIGSQPDPPINQEEYEPPSYTSQEHTIAEPPEGVCEAHRRVIPLYNYGSIN